MDGNYSIFRVERAECNTQHANIIQKLPAIRPGAFVLYAVIYFSYIGM